MAMNYYLIGVLVFLASICIIELLRFGIRNLNAVKRAKVKKRIRKYTFTQSANEEFDIIKKRVYSEVPLLNRLLGGLSPIRSLDRLAVQANVRLPIGFFILCALLLFVLAYWGVWTHAQDARLALLAAVCGLISPFAYLSGLKRRRIAKFQAQLPEGLDLIARSLKAGHAFTSGMKLAADEFGDPLGTEFEETLEEINYGVSTQKALQAMAARINCPEVNYFIVAVILQRETGGNLAELLEGLGQLMRKKVKFEGKVNALAAEGKLSAWILVIVPFLMALYLELNTPGYLNIFLTHPAGRIMLYGCSALMIAGIIVLRQMVNIKV
jgi:tight adherence protein B